MQQLKIKYKALGIIPIVFTRNIPEQWSELNPKQIIALGRIFLEKKTDDTQLIQQIYHIPKWLARQLPPYFVYCMTQPFSFMHNMKPVNAFIIKKIKGLIPPRPRLENMPFGQFVFADTYFVNYIRLKDKTMLHKFMASLYTPNNSFDEKTIAQRVKTIETVPLHTQQAVVINYQLIKEWLSQAYPLIFLSPVTDDKRPEAENKKKTEPNPTPTDEWLKIFDNLVGDDIINNEKYAKLPVHTVFRHITRKIKENAKSK